MWRFGLGALGTAWVISPLIESSGRAAVTNTDIASFLLSTAGLLTVIMLALSFVLGSMIEHIGVISIASARLEGREVTMADTLATLRAVAVRILSFGVAKLGLLAVLCTPFVVLAGLAYLVLLTRHDINYYLANRPPSWYLALAIGALLMTVLGTALLAALRRHDLRRADPLARTKRGPRGRPRELGADERARAWVGSIVLGWQLLGMIAGALIVWGFGRWCALVLTSTGSRTTLLLSVVAALLACHALLLAALSFAIVSIHGLLILRLYLECGGQPQPTEPVGEAGILVRGDALARRLIWSKAGIAGGILILTGCMAVGFTRRLAVNEQIVVVAHRGDSRVAPKTA